MILKCCYDIFIKKQVARNGLIMTADVLKGVCVYLRRDLFFLVDNRLKHKLVMQIPHIQIHYSDKTDKSKKDDNNTV